MAARAGITKSQTRRQGVAERRAAREVRDSFASAALSLGVGPGANNAMAGGTWGFNPITRQRIILEWMYRSSFARLFVDIPAQDMTKSGVDLLGVASEDVAKVHSRLNDYRVWDEFAEALKWGALYGGAVAVPLIDGQDMSQPLNVAAVGRGDFKGMFHMDRWMLDPDTTRLINDLGPNLGRPETYKVTEDAPFFRGKRLHHSWCFRFDGDPLPRAQALSENLWSASIFEAMYDLLVMDGSAITGASQLVYKSFLRVFKIKDLRKLLAVGGGPAMLSGYIAAMARNQSIEGITVIDGEDEFQPSQSQVNPGITDILLQINQRLAGMRQIPLVRLLGQAPAGLNSTGESDLRTHYDNIMGRCNRELRHPVMVTARCICASEGITVDDQAFDVRFKSLWDMPQQEQSEIAAKDADSIGKMFESGLIDAATALRELKARGEGVGGRWSSITEEMIDEAEETGQPPGIDMLGATGELENVEAEEEQGDDPRTAQRE